MTVVKGLIDYWRTVKDAPIESWELQKEITLARPYRGREKTLKTGPLIEAVAEFGDVVAQIAKRIEIKRGDNLKRLKWRFRPIRSSRK